MQCKQNFSPSHKLARRQGKKFAIRTSHCFRTKVASSRNACLALLDIMITYRYSYIFQAFECERMSVRSCKQHNFAHDAAHAHHITAQPASISDLMHAYMDKNMYTRTQMVFSKIYTLSASQPRIHVPATCDAVCRHYTFKSWPDIA